jgi:hypothetical protein
MCDKFVNFEFLEVPRRESRDKTVGVFRGSPDTFDPALVLREEGFQGFQVVASDNLVAALNFRAGFSVSPIGITVFQHPTGHVKMVVHHLIFADPFKRGHRFSFQKGIPQGGEKGKTRQAVAFPRTLSHA